MTYLLLIVFWLIVAFGFFIPFWKYTCLCFSPDDFARIDLYLTYSDEELKKVSFYDRMLVKVLKWHLGAQPPNEEEPALGKFSKLPAFFPKLVAKVYTNIIFMI
jgi:hypothetical protein